MERFIEPLVRAGISESTIEDILCKIDEARINEADADDTFAKLSTQYKANKEANKEAQKRAELTKQSNGMQGIEKIKKDIQRDNLNKNIKTLDKVSKEYFNSKHINATDGVSGLKNLKNDQDHQQFKKNLKFIKKAGNQELK